MVAIAYRMLAGLVRFFAWLFAVGTVVMVCLLLLSCLADPQGHNTMMSSEVDAWGLTYIGRRGAVLAFAEVVLVLGALWASRTRRPLWRFFGHAALILWSGLWAADAFYVFGDGSFGLIYIFPFFFLCTCLRAVLNCLPGLPASLRKRGRPAVPEVLQN